MEKFLIFVERWAPAIIVGCPLLLLAVLVVVL